MKKNGHHANPIWLLALVAGVLVVTPSVVGQAPRDVKGWHGAEWDMTPDQVAKAVNRPLGEAKPDSNDLNLIYYTVKDFTVGMRTVSIELPFKKSAAARALTRIILDLGSADFGSIRDELTTTYGAPTSEDHNQLPRVTEVAALAEFADCLDQNRAWDEGRQDRLTVSRWTVSVSMCR